MTSRVGTIVLIAALAFVGAVAFIATQFGGFMSRWRNGRTQEQSIMIRHPGSQAPTVQANRSAHHGLQNLAPLATVSVSSVGQSGPQAEGVADGTVDRNEWVTHGETVGAWIELHWDHPVTVMELELFDLSDPNDNVLGGLLNFDDGTFIPVPALPRDGSPWSVNFPPKTIQSVIFRINKAQGMKTGLAEIMVFGAPTK